MINFLITFGILFLIFIVIRYTNYIHKNKSKIIKFKKGFINKSSRIKRIYIRQEEKANLDPNANITISIYDSEEDIIRKSNIHRARLAKFKKSKLNGDLLFVDDNERLYKVVSGKKILIN